MKAAVVGGGASGLIALRTLVEQGCWKEVKVFEASDKIGGTWVYSPTCEETKFSRPTAMYENLRTNLPKDCMGFLDFDFPNDLPTFVGHKEVREYLESFVKRFNLVDNIQLCSVVTDLIPNDTNNPLTGSWTIQWQQSNASGDMESQQENFDHVVVCNGHYNTPFIPKIPGISNFKGEVLHSNTYRTNSKFKDKKVAIIGNGASASDIGFEIVEVAAEMHHCKREGPSLFNFESKYIQTHKNISRVDDAGNLLLEDGVVLADIDYLIYCTGFHYDMPFLQEERNKIRTAYKRICDLFCHIFPVNEAHPQYDSNADEPLIPPSIAFVGLPWKILPFPLFHVQCLFVARMWAGVASLPSIVKVRESIAHDIVIRKQQNLPDHYLHCLGMGQFLYCKKLLSMAGLSKMHAAIDNIEAIAMVTKEIRVSRPADYKDLHLMKENQNWIYKDVDNALQ